MLDSQLAKEKAPPTEQRFSSSNVASVARNAQAARAVLRTVVLAIESQEDGSISFDDTSGASRWGSAIGSVCSRLQVVRDELVGTSGAPYLDWFTPLTLVEALDAALWHGYLCKDDERLSNLETISAAKVVIDSLDELLQECDAIELVRTAPAH